MHHHQAHFKKTVIVFLLTLIISLSEIYYGISTHSHALMTDGWHLSIHVAVFGLAILAYLIKPKRTYELFILDYSGLIIGISILVIGAHSLIESITSISEPRIIDFEKAILISTLGFSINLTNILILRPEVACGDNNLKGIYLHIIFDLLTSIGAIIALLLAKYANIQKIDAVAGILISLVIIRWSVLFIRDVYKKLKS